MLFLKGKECGVVVVNCNSLAFGSKINGNYKRVNWDVIMYMKASAVRDSEWDFTEDGYKKRKKKIRNYPLSHLRSVIAHVWLLACV